MANSQRNYGSDRLTGYLAWNYTDAGLYILYGAKGATPETTLTDEAWHAAYNVKNVLAKQQPAQAKHINRPNVILILGPSFLQKRKKV